MQYKGRYNFFDAADINTYPLTDRENKVSLSDLVDPKDVVESVIDLPKETGGDIEIIAEKTVEARKASKPVIVFTGAHLIKNGLSPLLVDLVERDMVTLVAGNGATAIHDFELALIGQTSEHVPNALVKGQFGMAYEFAYINSALSVGNEQKLGYGESLGKMICDVSFRKEVLDLAAKGNSPKDFENPGISLIAACYRKNVPLTIHVGIGTDVTDQHASFDGRAKGGCSGRDFLIYTDEVSRLAEGGVVLNIGSAVTGPEVLLKAVSMVANVGKVPNDILTADFDLRIRNTGHTTDESAQSYYFRDQKSVVTRIPEAFNGKGFYIQGNLKQTVPFLYKKIIENL